MNKSVSGGDGNWGRPWRQTSTYLQIYCLGDLKVGHISAALLFHTILTQTFPDPDCVLEATGQHSQSVVIGFVRKWLRLGMGQKKITIDHAKDATDKPDILSYLVQDLDPSRPNATTSLIPQKDQALALPTSSSQK